MGVHRRLNQFAYRSGLHRMLGRVYGGAGTIFLMHRVVARKSDTLAGNVSITAAHLERVIALVSAEGREIVALDEAIRRLSRRPSRPFAVLTFDDGYRDNLELALPILVRYGVPATIFVPTGAPDRTLDAWWLRMECGLQRKSRVSLELDDVSADFALDSQEQKAAAFRRLSIYVSKDIHRRKSVADRLLPKHEVSDEALLADRFMGWDELREISAHPLITIGAHTVSHPVLSVLDDDAAAAEIDKGRVRLQSELNRPIEHFAYPFGDAGACGLREFSMAGRAGFRTAVTTRAGNVFRRHLDFPMALPRYVLGGERELLSDAALDLSGLPVGLRGWRWLNPVVTV